MSARTSRLAGFNVELFGRHGGITLRLWEACCGSKVG